ncbi:MAG: LPS export ABC transporter permease LptF [Desulfobacterales bacterium]|jgi:lipopolysaccharide export system permease protein|nr:LPS export ABC transporter permease LptF [Desulfobacterales bacterium]
MKINSVVNRYIFKELFAPFLLSVVFLLFIFLMTTLLRITDLVVNYHVGFITVVRMIFYSIPSFLEFIIPMSTMIAVLLTLLKMSNDNEIIALKAGGIGIYRLTPPILLFCILTFAATCVTTVAGLPWGKLSVRNLMGELKTSSYAALLKERTFNDNFQGMMVYFNKSDPQTKSLMDVFIEDRNNRGIIVTVTAPLGQLIDSPENDTFHLRLMDGFINQVQLKDKASHAIRFKTYDVRLNLKNAYRTATGTQKNKKEMSLSELQRFIGSATEKNNVYYEILIEFHKKFSLPFACIALGMLAFPLGIRTKFVKQSSGIGLGLLFFMLYYSILSAGWVFGEAGIYPPVIGMWLPNILFGGLGLFLLIRVANEKPLLFSNLIDRIKKTRINSLTDPSEAACVDGSTESTDN